MMNSTAVIETATILVGVAPISLYFGVKVVKRRIYGFIREMATNLVGEFMQDAIENPEKLAPLLDALTKQGMKSLGVTKESGLPPLKIGGLKIPGWLVQMGMPLIQGQMKKVAGETAEKAAEGVFG